ncbi:MAG TPA: serine hydrolase [Gemmatimonadaceae bacterium]|jgi:CubicO group peptidase (beta-lactamase class C family)|nr:serine hydrolase [Gemmatimonadaceae bacterium]
MAARIIALATALAACRTPKRLPATDTLTTSHPAVAGVDGRLGPTLDSIAAAAIRHGVASGVAIAVARYGRLIHLRGYGTTDWAAGSDAVTDSSLFDIASLTKVIATTTAAMILVEEGKLDLDRPVHYYVPELKARPKAVITPRMLLTHSAGFEAGAPLYTKWRGRAQYLKQINLRPLVYKPGTGETYSDWDMVVLQAVIERIARQALDTFATQRIFTPLGLRDTRFTPNVADPQLRRRIVATEIDPARGGLLRGIVDDKNAWALGGVAGHAGLFASARDLAVFAQMFLDGGAYHGKQFLRAETVAHWTARQSDNASRALGWDTPAPEASSGHYFSTRSFGHTGYTGTSVWLDPERGIFVVLLMNRINSRGASEEHLQVRRAVSDAVQESILDAPLIPWESRLTKR